MPHDFLAASRAAYLVLYDPAAIPRGFPFDPDTETGEPEAPPTEALEHLAATGKAFIVAIPDGDCEATIRVFIDEPLPESSDEHKTQSVVGARLDIPSGVLTADGVEFIHHDPNARQHANQERMTTTPGNYEVEVVEQIAWKETHRAAFVESQTTPAGRRITNIIEYFTCSWVVLFVSTILIIPAIIVIIWGKSGYVAGIIAIAGVVAVHAMYWTIFRILAWAADRWPAINQLSLAYEEFERNNPDILVVLRTIAAPPEQAVPGFLVIHR